MAKPIISDVPVRFTILFSGYPVGTTSAGVAIVSGSYTPRGGQCFIVYGGSCYATVAGAGRGMYVAVNGVAFDTTPSGTNAMYIDAASAHRALPTVATLWNPTPTAGTTYTVDVRPQSSTAVDLNDRVFLAVLELP